MKYRATVSYDGTMFGGFQRQANARSVQGEIEQALEKVGGARVSVVGAGRTDAGVHAQGQVIAFALDWKHGLDALTSAININLPEDVAVCDVAECAERFHPRFSALRRRYEYTLLLVASRQRLPLKRLYAWQVGYALDVKQMNAAAQMLVGTHDFAAFGTAPTADKDSTERTVYEARWRAFVDEQGVSGLRFGIAANGFLYRMVRRIVATLVQVGQGKLTADDVRVILNSRDGRRAKGLAPACGLSLVEVIYETKT